MTPTTYETLDIPFACRSRVANDIRSKRFLKYMDMKLLPIPRAFQTPSRSWYRRVQPSWVKISATSILFLRTSSGLWYVRLRGAISLMCDCLWDKMKVTASWIINTWATKLKVSSRWALQSGYLGWRLLHIQKHSKVGWDFFLVEIVSANVECHLIFCSVDHVYLEYRHFIR